MQSAVLVRVPCPICGAGDSRRERIVHGHTLERCKGCNFVFANPQYSRDDLVDDYRDRENPQSLIDHYARHTTAATLADYDRVLRWLEARLGEAKETRRRRFLDFGCGAGYFVERAAQRGWDAHGVEVGSWAREAAALRGVRNIHVGLLQDQGFPDGSFDVVCSNQVIEHLPTPREELSEVRRVLRPGGIFYANVPNYQCLSIVLGRDDFELNYPMAHVNYFTPRTFGTLLESCDLRVLRISTYGGCKWENLLGRPANLLGQPGNQGHQSAPEQAAERGASTGRGGSTGRSVAKLAKRAVYPLVDALLYRTAKVGMCLEAFCSRAD